MRYESVTVSTSQYEYEYESLSVIQYNTVRNFVWFMFMWVR